MSGWQWSDDPIRIDIQINARTTDHGPRTTMQLGFVSAILPDLSLADLFAFAADEGFECIELMCWPPGGADRRYAGVTHLDVTALLPSPPGRGAGGEGDALVAKVRGFVEQTGVQISALGYYPNTLH